MTSAVINEMNYSPTKPPACINDLLAPFSRKLSDCPQRVRLADLINTAFDEMMMQEKQTMALLRSIGCRYFETGLLRRAEQCVESSRYQSSVIELIELLKNNWQDIFDNENILFICISELQISQLDRTFYLCSPWSRLSITLSMLVKIMDKKGAAAFKARDFSLGKELSICALKLYHLDDQITELGKILAGSKQLRKRLTKTKTPLNSKYQQIRGS